MTGLELPQFICHSPSEYASRAAELVANKGELLEIKRGLRQRFYDSPFADAVSFTRDFEKLLLSTVEV